MRDLFDEFLEELRTPRGDGARRGSDQPRRRQVSSADDDAHRTTTGDPDDDAATTSPTTDADDDGRRRAGREPTARARAARGGPPRGDGRADRRRRAEGGRAGRRLVVLAIVVAVIVALPPVLTRRLDLWTDALWFDSGRLRSASSGPAIGAQAGLFLGGLVVALIVLLGNLWLAGRLGPPPSGGRAAAHPVVRRSPERRRRGRDRPRGRGRRARTVGGRGAAPAIVFEAEDSIPDLTPARRRRSSAVIAVLRRPRSSAASVGGAWETVLLWHPSRPVLARCVGRDDGPGLQQATSATSSSSCRSCASSRASSTALVIATLILVARRGTS